MIAWRMNSRLRKARSRPPATKYERANCFPANPLYRTRLFGRGFADFTDRMRPRPIWSFVAHRREVRRWTAGRTHRLRVGVRVPPVGLRDAAPSEWIWRRSLPAPFGGAFAPYSSHRSEERRVGKECRSRWSPYH